MKVLVTGGTGFIGRYLVDELIENGYDVRILTRRQFKSKFEMVKGDITKPETILNALDGIDAVFHNAAYAMDWGKKNIFYKVNVEGTRNLLLNASL